MAPFPRPQPLQPVVSTGGVVRHIEPDLANDAETTIELSVPDMHCGGCMRRVEEALGALASVRSARVNLTRRSVRIRGRAALDATTCINALASEGFAAHVTDHSSRLRSDAGDDDGKRLLRALAVAGFAAGNVMMLSISVWSGADGSWRTLFHMLSAAIALPALAYSGRIFFASAWRALRHAKVNMDVPISIGLLMTIGLSIHDTATRGEQIYFDAALMLVFFLLAGRTLEHQVRARARQAADALARLQPTHADVFDVAGNVVEVPLSDVVAGMRLSIGNNKRLPVDATLDVTRASIDRSHVTGESLPAELDIGDRVLAGSLNVAAPFTATAVGSATESFLSDMDRLMQDAGSARGRYRRIADRAAALYAPVVHVAAALSMFGWYALTGDLHRAMTVAVAVLIITCPCALGLAVPIVQVVATRRLFDHGVLLRDGAALERLGDVDTVVFDKTGTLTKGRAMLLEAGDHDRDTLALAAAIASGSQHPYARAIIDAARERNITPAILEHDQARDVTGLGREQRVDGQIVRLGRADWACAAHDTAETANDGAVCASSNPTSLLTRDGVVHATYRFSDSIRHDAVPCVAGLTAQSLKLEVLSGDNDAAVDQVAAEVGIIKARARTLPADKMSHVHTLNEQGHHVLMIGDGANDSPAMTAASVSMAPGSAADAGREAGDFILLHDKLTAIPLAVSIARRASRLVRMNIGLALAYNACALPLAVAGVVTPLIAALSMSLSSIIVIVNALRLSRVDSFERGLAS